MAQIRAKLDAGEAFGDYELRSAYQVLKILSHPKSRAREETKREAVVLYERLAGKAPVHGGARLERDPRTVTAIAVKRARGKLMGELQDYGLVVITADTPALMAAADELVLDGFAQAVSDRIERVRGGPTAAGSATRRERRVLKITGDQRI